MLELSLGSWTLIVCGAALIGVSKVGIPGMGILVVPLMALAMRDQAKVSVGFLLPMLAMADIIAILYWRRHVDWKQLISLLPWACVGVIAGYMGFRAITDSQLKPLIGAVVLLLIGGAWCRQRFVADNRIPTHWAFAAITGILAGAVSMMANAAGPIMIVYLLAKRFDKEQFVGTQAWFFWFLNLFKIPFMLSLGLITDASFKTNLMMIPAIILGGILGVTLFHRLQQKTFNRIMQLLAIAAAVKLCI